MRSSGSLLQALHFTKGPPRTAADPAFSTQNRGEDVIYVLDRSTKEELAFENIEHDFPRRISYKQQGDTLVVELSGVRNGNPQAEILKFTRTKQSDQAL